jgi:hypothetical protein
MPSFKVSNLAVVGYTIELKRTNAIIRKPIFNKILK